MLGSIAISLGYLAIGIILLALMVYLFLRLIHLFWKDAPGVFDQAIWLIFGILCLIGVITVFNGGGALHPGYFYQH